MKVHTFYENVPQIDSRSPQLKIIDLCKQSWERMGWEFEVINEGHAKTHHFYPEYSEFVANLESINPDKYDYYCFMRWLAMSNIGGGLMIDYDVANLGFSPSNLEGSDLIKKEKINVLQVHVPCVVYGTSEQYLEMCKSFVTLKDRQEAYFLKEGRKHTSDMLMLASDLIDFERIRIVMDYPVNAPLVHCSQASTEDNKHGSKLEIMQSLLGSL